MKPKLLLILVIVFGLWVSIFAQNTEFLDAKGSGSSELGNFARWEFEIGQTGYEVTTSGQARRILPNNKIERFRVPLGRSESVSSNFYFARYRNYLILMYEARMGGDGLGYIAAFDSASMKLKWKTQIGGFNVGKGLIEREFAYLTAIGFVAKIDLKTGKYLWKHDNFYRRYSKDGAFNIFETPELENGKIVFKEKTNDSTFNKLIIDKANGKILKIILKGK